MDYVKIPQNVRVEDKLIGPLSLRQIIIIAAGGGISYVLYALTTQASGGTFPPVAHAVVWIPLILCAAFALVKINDIPLTRYALLSFELMVKPRKRVWQPRRGLNVVPKMSTSSKKKKGKGEEVPEKEPTKRSDIRLEEISVLLDRAGENVTAPTNG